MGAFLFLTTGKQHQFCYAGISLVEGWIIFSLINFQGVLLQGVPKKMVRYICCMFFNNALFLLGAWKTLKTFSCSSFISEWKNVQDHSKRWKFDWFMKEIVGGYIIWILCVENIQDYYCLILFLKFLSFPKSYRENQRHFQNLL